MTEDEEAHRHMKIITEAVETAAREGTSGIGGISRLPKRITRTPIPPPLRVSINREAEARFR